ncbi:MAG TPA: hypothetical protein VME20_07210 [Acidimicrobiales bacterium]|nr:hypothetical protein [Acidimicrobiales bacterium]
MSGREPRPAFEKAQSQLNQATNRLAAGVLSLDQSRHRCLALGGRYDDLAARMAGQHPSLQGPAARLGELFHDLEAALGRLSGSVEALTAMAGRVADEAAEAAQA